jgi:hypothetical protein
MSVPMTELSPTAMASTVALTRAVTSAWLDAGELGLATAAPDVGAALRTIESSESMSPWAEARSPFARSFPIWLSSLTTELEALGDDATFESSEVVIPLAEAVAVDEAAPSSASCERVK